ARDFQRVINITTEVLTDDLLNDDARVLNEQAREKREASPFVEQSVRTFDQVLAAGNTAGARAELEKARSLDADHPAIAKMEASLPSAAPAPPPPALSLCSPAFAGQAPAPRTRSRATAQASDFGFTFEEEKAPEP